MGIGIDIDHTAATPPGLSVTVSGRLEKVSGRKLTFLLTAHDGIDRISTGSHTRFIIDADKFNAQVAQKRLTA